MNIRVRGRIQEIDGVGNTLLYRKLHCVEVIPKSAAERECIPHHPVSQFLRARPAIFHITQVVRLLWVVLHHANFLLSNDIAAEILVEIDGRLQSHAHGACLVVSVVKLFGRIYLVNMLPAAAAKWFQESGKPDIVEDLVPIQRKHQIPHRLYGGPRRVHLVRQQYRFRHGHP